MPRLIGDLDRAIGSGDAVQGNEALADLIRTIQPEDRGDVSVMLEVIPGSVLALIPPCSGAGSRNLLVHPAAAFSFSGHDHGIILVPLEG